MKKIKVIRYKNLRCNIRCSCQGIRATCTINLSLMKQSSNQMIVLTSLIILQSPISY